MGGVDLRSLSVCLKYEHPSGNPARPPAEPHKRKAGANPYQSKTLNATELAVESRKVTAQTALAD